MADVKVYGTHWCPDCERSKRLLVEQRVPFDWIDIDHDAQAQRYVRELQDGGRSIPTIVFPDGTFLVEPTNAELARKLARGLGLRR